MRRRLLVALAVAASLAATVPAHAVTPTEPTDWLLVKATGSDAGLVEITAEVKGSGTGAGPLLYGLGVASARFEPYLEVGAFPSYRMAVATSKDAGAFEVELLRGEDYSFEISMGATFDAPPNAPLAVLLFAANGTFDDIEVSTTGSGTPVTTTQGSGSTALLLTGGEGSGAAAYIEGAALGSVAAGATNQAHEPTAPIAGAFAFGCEGCAATWASPDERSGMAFGGGTEAVAVSGHRMIGARTFGGPAGSWAFSWTGADSGSILSEDAPAIGAFAPIGSDWALFAPPAAEG